VDRYSCRGIPGPNLCRRVVGCLGRRRNIRQRVTVRRAELQSAIVESLDLKALFVNRAMMPAAQQDEIR